MSTRSWLVYEKDTTGTKGPLLFSNSSHHLFTVVAFFFLEKNYFQCSCSRRWKRKLSLYIFFFWLWFLSIRRVNGMRLVCTQTSSRVLVCNPTQILTLCIKKVISFYFFWVVIWCIKHITLRLFVLPGNQCDMDLSRNWRRKMEMYRSCWNREVLLVNSRTGDTSARDTSNFC